ncbi:S41 family peptidase [candidate division KSB1 bacterium]
MKIISRKSMLYLFLILFIQFLYSDINAQQKIDGFWVGQFAGDPNTKMVMFFNTNDMGTIEAVSFLVGRDKLMNNENVQLTITEENNVKVYFPGFRAQFEGIADFEKEEIAGQVTFPGSASRKAPLTFKKFDEESVPAIAEIKKKLKTAGSGDMFSEEQLIEDFNFLVKELKENHPQLYTFQSKEEFEELVGKSKEKISGSMKLIDFTRIVIPVVVSAHCYHTKVLTAGSFFNRLFKDTKLLPLNVFMIGNKAYITQNCSGDPDLEPGTEIVSINGNSIPEIKKCLFDYVSADGNNTTLKQGFINNSFPIMYYVIESPDKFDLKIKKSGSKETQTVSVNAADIQELMIKFSGKIPERGGFPLRSEYLDNEKTAVLTVRSFEVPDFKKFSAYLKDFFLQLSQKRIRNLIIDVRGNAGGQPELSFDMLRYLVKNPFTYFDQSKTSSSKNKLLTRPADPHEITFNGNVYVLCDGGSLSSTGHFLSHIKYHKLGTIIGEEPGGSFWCNSGPKRISLPNTGINVEIARSITCTAVEGYKIGDPVIPDVTVNSNIDDVIAGKDSVMEYALKMIEKKAK